MSEQADLKLISLHLLKHRCSEESDRYFRRQAHDPRYCFELVRRAIAEQDQNAWNLIYLQYQPLVTGWIQRHSLYSALDEELQFFVNRAFEKMWQVLTPEKFAQFPDLKSVLRYLQMCVHSVIVDYMRAREQAMLLDDLPEGPAIIIEDSQDGPEALVADRSQAETLWQWITQRLKNDLERQVVYCSYVLDLKPGEIFAAHQDLFDDVQTVYQIKENVLARLRRDRELMELL